MSNLYIAHERERLFRRLETLTAEARSSNGVVSGHHTVIHLSHDLDVMLGEEPASTRSNLWSRSVGSWLVLNFIPWPERLPRAESGLHDFAPQADAGTFASDFDALIERIRRFDARCKAGSIGPHPRYGRLSRNSWGKYLYLHIDWHLSMLGL